MSKITSEELAQGLKQFYGSATFTRHHLNRRLLHTEGADYFANKAGAFWFIDLVALGACGNTGIVPHVVPRESEFATVFLKSTGTAAVIEAYKDSNSDGSYPEKYCIFRQPIEFTDCPAGDWKFFLIDDGDNSVLMLPSEY